MSSFTDMSEAEEEAPTKCIYIFMFNVQNILQKIAANESDVST